MSMTAGRTDVALLPAVMEMTHKNSQRNWTFEVFLQLVDIAGVADR